MKKPRINFYRFKSVYISFLPYMNFGYYPYQGVTSIGCLKYQVQAGWLVFGFSCAWNHELSKNDKAIIKAFTP